MMNNEDAKQVQEPIPVEVKEQEERPMYIWL